MAVKKYFGFVWVERGAGYSGGPGNLAASFPILWVRIGIPGNEVEHHQQN